MNKIGFIGAGNMAGSLIGGLLNAGYQQDFLAASDPVASQQVTQLGIELFIDNKALAEWADIIVLAIKPQTLKTVCEQIATTVNPDKLIISIAAGIRTSSISRWLSIDIPCIRVMPNTPALIGLGMSGLYANARCSEDQINTANDIVATVGQVIRFEEESKIDAVTAISGSGPAYFFLLIETMTAAAIRQGISETNARALVLQTALGAASMASQSDVGAEELRHRVTSPGGTTEQAIQTFMDGNLQQLVNDAVNAAVTRSLTLSRELAEDSNE